MRDADVSILDPVLRCAETEPDRLMYTFSGPDGEARDAYTYASFARRSNEVAAYLKRKGVCGSGDRVLLVYPPGIEILVAFFACARLGAIPVPVAPPAGRGFSAGFERMNFIARDCGASAVLTSRSYLWSMRLGRLRSRLTSPGLGADSTPKLRWEATDDATDATDVELVPRRADLLFLQYTSGSTREPRGVMVGHRNVLANCRSVFDRPPIGASWLPQYHDMGLIGSCLFPPLLGGTSHLMSPIDFLQRPGAWLRLVERTGATASAAPNFAYEFCLRRDRLPDEELEGLDLGSLEILMSGAEPVRADVFTRFRRRFAPHGLRPRVLSAAYGLAEYTLAVSNRGTSVRSFDAGRLARGEVVPLAEPPEPPRQTEPAEARERAGRDLVSCGPPLASTRVRIVDTSGDPALAAPGEVGEIWLDGAAKAFGYWGRPDLSKRIFEARLATEPDTAWLRTGDLGFVCDGEIFVCGRIKDLIIVRGVNYYPQDIEAVVAEDPAIRPGCVAAFACDTGREEELVVVAELRSADTVPDPEALNSALLGELGVTAAEFVFVRKRSIEKTSSGKIRRHAVRSAWASDDLRIVERCRPVAEEASRGSKSAGSEPPEEEAEWGTPSGLAQTFRRRGLTGKEPTTLADTGLDSLGLVELALDLEKHLDAAGVPDVGRVIDLRWLQRIQIVELVPLLRQVIAADMGAVLRLHRAFAELRREHQEVEWEMMREDARMGLPSAPRCRAGRDGRGVLLTGATGFFGPFLLRALLERTDEPVRVLVRADSPEHGRERVLAALYAVGGPSDPGAVRRLEVVCGDLSRPSLGLSRDAWEALAARTRAVYHNGAWVNYLHDYATLRGANVLGTREVLRLACHDEAKEVNHVSTTFIFGWSTKSTLHESDGNDDLRLLDFGYSQSKWVSERLVERAIADGLPGRIFRPALIAPSLDGKGESFDIAIRLLAAMVKYGLTTSAVNQVSMSPADVVAENIVAIAGVEDTIGGTFHVTRDEYSTMKDITDLLGARTGAEFTVHALDRFVPEMVGRCRAEDPLFPLLNFLVRSVDNISAMEFKLYDSRRYRAARDRAPGARVDPPLSEVVDGLVAFMDRHGLLDDARALPPRS